MGRTTRSLASVSETLLTNVVASRRETALWKLEDEMEFQTWRNENKSAQTD